MLEVHGIAEVQDLEHPHLRDDFIGKPVAGGETPCIRVIFDGRY